MTSTDRVRWQTMTRANIVDLAADPTRSEQVLATRPNGELTRFEIGRSVPTKIESPPLVLADWPEARLLVGVGPGGEVFHSRNSGRSWEAATKVPGTPAALDVTAGRWHVATDQAIFESADNGATWSVLAAVDD